MSGVAFIEGCPHARGGLYRGSTVYREEFSNCTSGIPRSI